MDNKDELKSVLGIAYLFTVISAAFSLLTRMTGIFSSGNPQDGAISFLHGDFLWFVIALGIIFVLNRLNSSCSQSLGDVLNEAKSRKAVAVLLMVDGLLKLADAYADFARFVSTLRSFQSNGIGTDGMIGALAANVVCLVVFLIQILVGVYLLRQYRSKSGGKRA